MLNSLFVYNKPKWKIKFLDLKGEKVGKLMTSNLRLTDCQLESAYGPIGSTQKKASS